SITEDRSFVDSFPLKKCSIVPHARTTHRAIYLTSQTTQAQHNTRQNGNRATVQFRCVAGFPQETSMITQPNPHLEAQASKADSQKRHHLHLPGRPHLRLGVQDTHTTNIALASFQLLLGYEWLLAGGDKILLGAFPAQLGGMLLTLVNGGHLVGFFTAILQGLVAPNAV